MRKKSLSEWALTNLPLTSRTRSVQAYLEVPLMYGHLKIGLDLLSAVWERKPFDDERNYISVLRSATVSHPFPSLQDRRTESRTTDRLVGKVRGDTMLPQLADKI
jgi:hypothetical protein